jgi:hypothetical protein
VTAATATIFDVLADRARRHSGRFLAVQAVVCACVAAVLLTVAGAWWPLSSLLVAVGCYSLWGVVDAHWHLPAKRSVAITKRGLAILATLACLAAAVGTAFTLFVGDGSSPYGVCYGADGRAFSCNSRGERR